MSPLPIHNNTCESLSAYSLPSMLTFEQKSLLEPLHDYHMMNSLVSQLQILQGLLQETSIDDKEEDHAVDEIQQQVASTATTPPTQGAITEGMPFQSAFAYILLDKYIPSQEQALFALGKELNVSGYAQNLFSPLLEAIKSFNSAPIAYNLGSYISQTNGTANFRYGYDLIMERFENERAQLRKDMRGTEQAKLLVRNIASNISGHPSLTAEQQQQLKDILDGYTQQLEVISGQLKDLMTCLNTLVFMPGSDPYDPSYVVMGSDSAIVSLQNAEGLVVDGAIDIDQGTSNGGLLNFFNKCLADVQNFGELAQTTQLMLELQLRAMQQQWSLVASALKLLHNSYRTMANGYGR